MQTTLRLLLQHGSIEDLGLGLHWDPAIMADEVTRRVSILSLSDASDSFWAWSYRQCTNAYCGSWPHRSFAPGLFAAREPWSNHRYAPHKLYELDTNSLARRDKVKPTTFGKLSYPCTYRFIDPFSSIVVRGCSLVACRGSQLLWHDGDRKLDSWSILAA
jgi:hypothetical protein